MIDKNVYSRQNVILQLQVHVSTVSINSTVQLRLHGRCLRRWNSLLRITPLLGYQDPMNAGSNPRFAMIITLGLSVPYLAFFELLKDKHRLPSYHTKPISRDITELVIERRPIRLKWIADMKLISMYLVRFGVYSVFHHHLIMVSVPSCLQISTIDINVLYFLIFKIQMQIAHALNSTLGLGFCEQASLNKCPTLSQADTSVWLFLQGSMETETCLCLIIVYACTLHVYRGGDLRNKMNRDQRISWRWFSLQTLWIANSEFQSYSYLVK